MIYHFQLIALVWSVRSTTVKDIGYRCLSSQIVDLVYIWFHLYQLTEERVITTHPWLINCYSFLSEWFKFQSMKFLLITIRSYFKHPFTLIFSKVLQIRKHYSWNKLPPQTENTLEIKNCTWIDNWSRINRSSKDTFIPQHFGTIARESVAICFFRRVVCIW